MPAPVFILKNGRCRNLDNPIRYCRRLSHRFNPILLALLSPSQLFPKGIVMVWCKHVHILLFSVNSYLFTTFVYYRLGNWGFDFETYNLWSLIILGVCSYKCWTLDMESQSIFTGIINWKTAFWPRWYASVAHLFWHWLYGSTYKTLLSLIWLLAQNELASIEKRFLLEHRRWNVDMVCLIHYFLYYFCCLIFYAS